MKVLLASNMYTYPGNWDKLEQLSRYVELQVVTPARWATEKELHPIEDAPRYTGDAWVHHPLPTITQGNPFRHVYHLAPLVHVLRAFRPDIVHVEQEPESLSLLQLSLLKPLFNYRLLFVAWENVHPLPQGWLFRKLNFRAADGGLFGNQAALDRCARYGWHKPSALIPQYGFEVNRRAPKEPTAGKFVVGYAGRLVPEKGVLTLLQAMREFPSVELLVAGDGPLADELRGDPHVNLLGKLDRRAMQEFWQTLDAFVLPSLTTKTWAEQFGRVLVEAMAAGVPVIGSSSAAIPEVVADAGLIFPEGDAPALANAIKQLRGDAALRASLIEKGYQRVQRVYHYDVIMRRTVQFYHELLNARSGAAWKESRHAAQH
ncbi:MAG: glycosyltransferase family 4 protein [Chloroflexi bacterium]|nr:glycosyltransferase family 4 protein [Chloroflexota bacterium]